MRMRTLGGTGIKVSSYCLGAMMFGAWGNPDHEESIRIIHAALDAGINFVDTADVYSAGESEEMHRTDPDTDIDETLSALSDLIHSGKVRAVGSSTFPAEQIVEAQWVAQSRGRERFRCEQPPYSIFVRGIEGNVLPTCQKYGMGVIAWSPLAGGWLTGRIRRDTGVDMTKGRAQRIPQRFDLALPGNQAKLAAVEELIKIAADAGCPLTHLALAFVTGKPAVTSAIIGPRTMDQLTDLLAGASVTLDDDVLDRIDQIVPPGANLNPAHAGWPPSVLVDPAARRRPQATRSAS